MAGLGERERGREREIKKERERNWVPTSFKGMFPMT
jgi:hypothetical protein